MVGETALFRGLTSILTLWYYPATFASSGSSEIRARVNNGIANQEFIDLAGDAANGVIFPGGKVLVADGLPDSDSQKANIVQYKKDFDAKYHREANHFGAHAYDAIVMLQMAIGKAGNDKAKVRDEIEKIQGFPGIGGVFNMSAAGHNGLSKGSLGMIQIQNGKWTLYKD